MSFGRRGGRRGLSADGGGHGDDLQITPLLDLFVALIPFLIVSIVMTKIHTLDVGISRPVASASAPQGKPFDLLLKIGEKSADLTLNGKMVKSLPRSEDTKWAGEIRKSLVEIKRQFPDEFKLRIEPAGKIALQTLIIFMDQARVLKPEDGEILRKDETGKTVKLQFLFPNIILRGVYT